jgi:3-phenylpropionate/trans-cinnamate dioxygenase ferredoxin subunit
VFALEIVGDEVYVDITTVTNSAPVPDRG